MAGLVGDVRSRGHNGSRISGPSLPFLTDTVEKVFWGWRTKFSRAADAFCAQRCEGPTSHLRKTTTDFRIGATAHLNGGVVQKSAFARFLASFDFRLFQQYRPNAEMVSDTQGHDFRKADWIATMPSLAPEPGRRWEKRGSPHETALFHGRHCPLEGCVAADAQRTSYI
jgi:hypothetical protein